MDIEAGGSSILQGRTFLETIRCLIGLKKRPEELVPTDPSQVEFKGLVLISRDPRMPFGGRLIHFQGQTEEYEVEHYMGDAYKLSRPLLTGIITNLHRDIFDLDPSAAKKEIKPKMDASGANVMLFRPVGKDDFVGFAILRRMSLAGHWVLNIDERALLEEHRRHHIGRFVVGEAIRFYDQDRHEPIEVVAHKTQSAAAVLSTIESGEIGGGLAPFQRRYTEDPELRNVLRAYYLRTRSKFSIGLDPAGSGVSRGEYAEGASAAYTPDPSHHKLMEIHNYMEKVLGLNRQEGDAVNCLGWTRAYMNTIRGSTT
ncbi:hypothetical protein HYU45_02170 [Candidatus Daviesbacteria bacterium]|nr:hypothetical protein [Candidatus Daviesbacteria bacterium]